MSMGTPNAAWKAVCIICVFLFICQRIATAQQLEHDSRLNNLFSSDPAVRGAAKTAMLEHPDPTLLPALLEAVPASAGTIRDDILEILAKYDDPRKIPVLLGLLKKSFAAGGGTLGIDEQLSRLGAPAAEALLANCTNNEDEDYARWAATPIGWMHETGAHFLIQAVQSDDTCKHNVGEDGLFFMFGDADPNAVSRADIQLATDAAIEADERIRGAARRWLGSRNTKEYIDFSGIVEELISVYQSNAPPETMVKIADMLSKPERPRVTRFMRAAVHAPNPEVQRIANRYLSLYAAKTESGPARVNTHPRSPEEKKEFLGQLSSSPQGDVNAKILPFMSDRDAHVRAAAASALGDANAASTDGRDAREIHPETASPALTKALKDSSPLVRSAAAEALGHLPSYDDLASPIAALKDSDTSVALSAAKAIQQISNDSAVPALTQIYRDEKSSPELRNQALLTLETIGNPDSIPIFLEDLRSDGKEPSVTAAWALQCALEKRPDPSAFEPIREALEEAQDPWRSYLVAALGATKNPKALDVLVPLLKSQNPILPPKAADALGLLGDRRAIPILAGLLEDPDYTIRESAASALTRFADFSAPPELIAALGDSDTNVQWNASNALLLSHDPKAIDALIGAMPHTIYALGESHDPRVVPALIAFLQNPANESGDRASAAISLGKLGDLRAVEPLAASLNEHNASITAQASSALGALKDKRAIEPLKQAYARWSTGERENADSVRNFIIQALLELGVTDAIQRTTGTPAH